MTTDAVGVRVVVAVCPIASSVREGKRFSFLIQHRSKTRGFCGWRTSASLDGELIIDQHLLMFIICLGASE